MHSITSKNKTLIVRSMLLVMLFQLLSLSISAMALDTKKNGYYSTVCTFQGYKQVWINEDSQNNNDFVVLDCPYCLSNFSELDAIDKDLENYFVFLNDLSDNLSITRNQIQSDVLLKSFTIRSPPYTYIS